MQCTHSKITAAVNSFRDGTSRGASSAPPEASTILCFCSGARAYSFNSFNSCAAGIGPTPRGNPPWPSSWSLDVLLPRERTSFSRESPEGERVTLPAPVPALCTGMRMWLFFTADL